MVVLPAVQTRMASSIKWPYPPGSRHMTAASAYRSSLGSPNTANGSNTTNTNKVLHVVRTKQYCFSLGCMHA